MVQGRLKYGLGRALAWAFSVALVACTEPLNRPAATPIEVVIDADGIVRDDTVRVEIFLEGQKGGRDGASSSTWESIFDDKVFRPDPAEHDQWPWRHTLNVEESGYERYDLLAIARDGDRVVVARAQAIRTSAEAHRHGLRLRFDSRCFRPMKPCADGYTCVGGACVDASFIANADRDGGTSPPGAVDGSTGEPSGGSTGVATSGTTCEDGERACVGHGSRTPLLCEGGNWSAQADCAENERCVTPEGPMRGMCQPVADECRSREPNVAFCDGETMKLCVDLVDSQVLACSENERCAPTVTGAECVCDHGFMRANNVCTRAMNCDSENGGCDGLTECRLENGEPVCSACPPGYTGRGEDGCHPLLQDLAPSAGVLEPAFAPEVREYRLNLPLLAPRVVFRPIAPARSTVTVNGAKVNEGGAWSSPLLPLAETRVDIEVTSESRVTTKYTVVCDRKGEQSAYLKDRNAGSYDQYGSAVDVSGDTVVVTAWFEDSGATGVDGSATNMDATDSGAAFVYVREAGAWKQQAYLKPSDTMTYDYFGSSADLDGDRLIIGAIHEGLFEDATGDSRPGAAYVFERSGGKWSEKQIIESASPRADMFGTAVALEGDRLVVGAPWDATHGSFAGAVYVYEHDGQKFNEVQKVFSAQPAADARFGAAVGLNGDRLVVGAPDGPPPHQRPGSAEAFVRKGGMFTSTQLLRPMTLRGAANFGYSVSVRGDTLAISAPYTSAYPGSPTPTSPGQVFVYEAEGDGWKQLAQLEAPSPRATDWFGLQLQLTDQLLVIGAPGDASGARGIAADSKRTDAPFAGAAYLYARSQQGGWSHSAFIKADNAGADDWFGRAVASDGETLVVGAMFENDGGARTSSGAVYVFR